jgi:hypothetical protein
MVPTERPRRKVQPYCCPLSGVMMQCGDSTSDSNRPATVTAGTDDDQIRQDGGDKEVEVSSLL